MAEIRNYQEERAKREKQEKKNPEAEYHNKLRKHRMVYVYRTLLIVLVVGAVGALVLVQYLRHIYTGYETVSSMKIEEIRGATNLPFAGEILTYSKDGARCSDGNGEMKWNLTYEMQNPIVRICRDTVAIADYNGRTIYIAKAEGPESEIQTNMPIRSLCVSATGLVAVALEEADITWIYLYDPDGNVIVKSQTTMEDYGYPVAIDISPNGALMMVSFLYPDEEEIKTRIAFFNFDEVGKSKTDNLVGGYNYTDSVIPYVQFMDDAGSFAAGDNRIVFYQGANIPEFLVDHMFTQKMQGVYYNEDYVGTVFLNDSGESRYRLVIYSKLGEEVLTYDFDMDYTDIFFDKNTFAIYNDEECIICTVRGREKYRGTFEKPAELLLPTAKAYRYVLVTQDSIDTIALQ